MTNSAPRIFDSRNTYDTQARYPSSFSSLNPTKGIGIGLALRTTEKKAIQLTNEKQMLKKILAMERPKMSSHVVG